MGNCMDVRLTSNIRVQESIASIAPIPELRGPCRFSYLAFRTETFDEKS
jgi:hypothetical protein